jgi:hypothetical protein
VVFGTDRPASCAPGVGPKTVHPEEVRRRHEHIRPNAPLQVCFSRIDLVARKFFQPSIEPCIRELRSQTCNRIGAQNPERVVTRLGFDLLFINSEMAIALDLQKAPIAFIADQALVAAMKFFLQVRGDCFRLCDNLGSERQPRG